MPKITLENIPDTLHARLCKRAKRHDRSVAEEVMSILERELSVSEHAVPAGEEAPAEGDTWDPIAKAEEINRRLGRTFPDIVNEAKREGRMCDPVAEAEELNREIGRTFDDHLIEEGKREGRA